MTLIPDYDSDPGRWASWRAPRDVHEVIGPKLRGPVLDAACGDGRLAQALHAGVLCVGADSSPSQLDANPHSPLVRADMRALPFRDGSFAEVVHLWCLYHLDEPVEAIEEARRVLRPNGRYYAATGARDSDPELMWEGYPRSTFDAEDAAGIVGSVFGGVVEDRWDGPFVTLPTREDIRAYCRHHFIPSPRAEAVTVPLRLTKRGVLIRARR
jgi:SAM-dependent methyltransferase